MTPKQLEVLLKTLHACDDARQWATGKSLKQAWNECERADWMLWLCGRMIKTASWPTREEIVLVACDLAETALPLFEKKYPKDHRPRKAIEAARAWANCTDGSKNKKAAAAAAAYAAAAAAYAAYDAAAYDAAAAAAAYAAAYAAYDAAAAAYAAYDAAAYDAAAYDAAAAALTKRTKLKEFANVVRERLTVPFGKD